MMARARESRALNASSRGEAGFSEGARQDVDRGPHHVTLKAIAGVAIEPARKPGAIIIADTLDELGERHRLVIGQAEGDVSQDRLPPGR